MLTHISLGVLSTFTLYAALTATTVALELRSGFCLDQWCNRIYNTHLTPLCMHNSSLVLNNSKILSLRDVRNLETWMPGV